MASTTRRKIHAAAPGDIVNFPHHGRRHAGEARQVAVREACSAEVGFWACSTHEMGFAHNLDASSHEYDDQEHTVYWFCTEQGHGPEFPR